jgi:hypothetical protein
MFETPYQRNEETMDERVARLTTPEECEQFAKNADERGHPDLAKDARRRGVELRAIAHGAHTDVEREALQAVYAVEEVATHRNGRKTRASRTWQSFERHGILETVQRAVCRRAPTEGYEMLVEMGMDDFTFEAVVLRYPTLFRPETVERAQERVNQRA